MTALPLPIISQPGIKRDGTVLSGDQYEDAQWCRWDRNYPRKIGGYVRRSSSISGICRGMDLISRNQYSFIHMGMQDVLQQININNLNGTTSGITDRTPAGYTPDPLNMWQFATMYDGAGTAMYLLAHAAPNLMDISSDVALPFYYGDAFGTGALTAVSSSDVSGGISELFPYLTYYGSDGFFGWSVPNNPSDIAGAGSGDARVCGSKIVKGLPMRGGGGSSPAGIYWALDALVRCTFVGGAAIFDFDILSGQTSIMSAASVIEFDGVYYWIGADRFLMFNGVVRELSNTYNIDWFFRNLNREQVNKVFAVKVPRWGEIWWFFPYGQATECTHAIIYNTRGGIWYDTRLPSNGRSSGHYAQTFPYPVMTSTEKDGDGNTALYQHEIGVDAVEGDTLAIPSYFVTSPLAPAFGSPPSNDSLTVSLVEPDFLQSGDLQMTIIGKQNARSKTLSTPPIPINQSPVIPADQVSGVKRMTARQLQFKFESNVKGGDYYMGRCVAHVDRSSQHLLGPTEDSVLPEVVP